MTNRNEQPGGCYIAGRGNERAFTALGFGHSEQEAINHARRRAPHILKFWDMIDVRKITVEEYRRLACDLIPIEKRKEEQPTSLPASWIGGRVLYSLRKKGGRYIPIFEEKP